MAHLGKVDGYVERADDACVPRGQHVLDVVDSGVDEDLVGRVPRPRLDAHLQTTTTPHVHSIRPPDVATQRRQSQRPRLVYFRMRRQCFYLHAAYRLGDGALLLEVAVGQHQRVLAQQCHERAVPVPDDVLDAHLAYDKQTPTLSDTQRHCRTGNFSIPFGLTSSRCTQRHTHRLQLGDDAAGLLLVERELVLRPQNQTARHGRKQEA